MKLKSYIIFSFLAGMLILIILNSVVLIRPAQAQEKQDSSQEFLPTLSRELNVPTTSLQIVNETALTLPYLNRRIPTAKVLNLETGMIYEVTLDESGLRINADELIAQDFAIKKDRYGKLEPELHNLLQAIKDNDTVEVAIWLAAPDEPLKRPTLEDINIKGEAIVEAEMETQAGEKKARIADIQKPLSEHLQMIGAEIRDINGLAPVISARLTKGQIHANVSRSDVDGVYLSRENKPLLNISAPTIFASQVWGRGITGLNQKVAIIEEEGIYFSNPYLTGRGYNRLNSCIGNSPSPYHATMVAGVVASNHPSYKGIAYNANILGGEACSFNDADLIAATGWARDRGARVHNNSWGFNNHGYPTNMSRFHDTVVRDWGITVVDAAGNCNPDCYVSSPALAYNVIAVGAFDDNNTTPWTDDVMASFSSYIDPIAYRPDRQKPEVAAPGVNIVTTFTFSPQCGPQNNPDPWLTCQPGVSGTSIAAPHVAGGAALLMQRQPILKYWPTAVKAILMATADNNIEGDFRLSDYDGAGGISLDYADDVANTTNNNEWRIATVSQSSFTCGSPYQLLCYSFYATKDQIVRAVIAWDTSPSYIYYDEMPGTDLDMWVNSPSGNFIEGSYSWSNTYEIVDFKAPDTGTYTMYISYRSIEDGYTHLGVAWFNYVENKPE